MLELLKVSICINISEFAQIRFKVINIQVNGNSIFINIAELHKLGKLQTTIVQLTEDLKELRD